MFAVIYSFKVKPSRDKQFIEAWKALTELIYQNRGSLGSRLHKSSSGEYIAYAQWTDQSTWEKPWKDMTSEAKEASFQMHDACVEIKTLYRLEMTSDLLKDFPFNLAVNH